MIASMGQPITFGRYPIPVICVRSGDILGTVWIKPDKGWTVREEVWSMQGEVTRRLRELRPDRDVPAEFEGTVGRHPTGLVSMISANLELDDNWWLHVSISRGDRLPDYQDLVLVKDGLIGPKRKAMQLFVPRSEHVNDHEFCLHLWSPVNHEPWPDFTRGNGTI